MDRRYHPPFFIGLTLLTAAVLKGLYAVSSTEHLLVLLSPTSFLVGCSLGIPAQYSDAGFYLAPLHVVIDKSCSGLNFMVILFTALATTAPYRYLSLWRSVLLFTGLLLLSLALTPLVNTSRIVGAIALLKFKAAIPFLASAWMHEAEGAFVYLTALTITYLAIRKFYLTIENHAQHSTSRLAVPH